MKAITIRDIKAFVTAPHGNNLVVVKVETSEPELYGVGCATFTWQLQSSCNCNRRVPSSIPDRTFCT